MARENVNPEIREKVKELEKKHPGLKVNRLKSMHGKIDIKVE